MWISIAGTEEKMSILIWWIRSRHKSFQVQIHRRSRLYLSIDEVRLSGRARFHKAEKPGSAKPCCEYFLAIQRTNESMNRASLSGAFALSSMQQGMLFHYLKDPHSGVDIEQIVVHLPEKIDVQRLENAWQWLLRRHDILRTKFVWEGNETQQEVSPEVAVPFVVHDERGLLTKIQDERLKAFLQADRVRGFDPSEAPMLRLALFQWGEESFSLVWTFHHALLDGRSYPVLLREVFEAYAELRSGAISQRVEPFSYRRYIEWLQERNFDAAELFWQKQLAGFTAATPLVVDRQSAPDADTYQQGEAWEQLDATVTRVLRKLAKTHDLTLNSVVMGAWAILLHKYSREEEIVFAAN